MIPAITSNFTAKEQLQLDQQSSWQLIARADETETDEEHITPGKSRDR
ncbi:hypothetical protein ACP6PL_13735 [Dapis sp. BLCC M126]